MTVGVLFFCNGILLGIGLSMDAFSVSLANGLQNPCMKRTRMYAIAAIFAFFQALMPMIGWFCIHTVVNHFVSFERYIPWVALILLGYIGGKMLWEGICGNHSSEQMHEVGWKELFLQGIATSIDALSVGFTIAEYECSMALSTAIMIAAVTFGISFLGLEIGKRVGTKLAGKASVLGGIILIAIGLEIFITGNVSFG